MNKLPIAAAGIIGSIVAASISVFSFAQQPTPAPAQPNQPAQPAQPQPSQTPNQPTQPNTIPPERPSPNQPVQPNTATPNQQNPTQPPAQPVQPGTVQPGTGQPGQPGNVNPGNLNPGNSAQPGTVQPSNGILPDQLRLLDPNDPTITPEQRASLVRLRSQRPFPFQSVAHEAQFNQNAHSLLRAEQRFEKSTQDHLRRLGEVRNLAGERQNAALLDLLQQMLQDRVELQRYLADSRAMYTGDVSLPQDSSPAGGDNRSKQVATPPADANRQTNVPGPGSNSNPRR